MLLLFLWSLFVVHVLFFIFFRHHLSVAAFFSLFTYLIHILRNDDDESTGYIWWCCVYVCSHDGRCWLVLWSPDQIRRSVIWITFNFFFSFFAFSQLTDNYIYLLFFLRVLRLICARWIFRPTLQTTVCVCVYHGKPLVRAAIQAINGWGARIPAQNNIYIYKTHINMCSKKAVRTHSVFFLFN